MWEKWRLALYLSMRVASSMKSLHLFLNSKQRTKLKTAEAARFLRQNLKQMLPVVIIDFFVVFPEECNLYDNKFAVLAQMREFY